MMEDMEMEGSEESMENVAMKSSMKARKAKKLEEMKRKQLRNVKKNLGMDDYYGDEPLELSAIEERFIETVKGLKDPLVKSLLPAPAYKKIVNGMISITKTISKYAEIEEDDLLKPV